MLGIEPSPGSQKPASAPHSIAQGVAGALQGPGMGNSDTLWLEDRGLRKAPFHDTKHTLSWDGLQFPQGYMQSPQFPQGYMQSPQGGQVCLQASCARDAYVSLSAYLCMCLCMCVPVCVWT
jgi:hypothetical protein